MKRYGNLYNKICDIKNLYKAELRARKGKSKNKEIVEFIKNLDSNILSIYNELANKTYTTSEYIHFIIYEPKERKISKLPYRDRIVHHAVMLHIESIFLSSFISQTYSCIKKRGIHRCLRDLNRGLMDVENTKYCLKLDIKKFYPSIDGNILKETIRRKIKDKDVLWLLDDIISSTIGCPLGNLTSQWFGNLYLNKFDRWIKEQKKVKYYKYCDDIVILHSSKEFLHGLLKEIKEYLWNNLKLELSNHQIFPVESRGIDFVGYKSFHTHILIRDRIKKKFIKMIKYNKNECSINSYLSWLNHSNSINLKRKYL